ncbi:exopolysaccharide biosynthesis polyprenyl glycosylphosphotransferase [Streptomyces sp. 846.5]|nr:sugar transferase [Streptomyces sp. 846.5]TDU03579.1 exopolysaccharide biosynthesis polyprenyl glycosylphosphotransferase [Streptomyces sp. 846.5]
MTTIDNDELPRATASTPTAPTLTGPTLTGPTPSGLGTVQLTSPSTAVERAAAVTAPAVRRRRRRAGTGIPAALLAVDALAPVLALALLGSGEPVRVLWAAFVILPVLVLLNSYGGLYRLRLAPSVLDEIPSLAARAAVAVSLALTLDRGLHGLWLSVVPVDLRLLVALVLCQLGLDVLGRGAVYALLRRHHRRRPRPTLIAGAGHIGQRIAAALLDHPEYGLRPVGFIDPEPLFLPSDSAVPVLGGPAVLDLAIPARGIRDVILTSGGADDAEVAQTLRTSSGHGCEVWFVPGFPEFGAFEYGNRRTVVGDHLWGFPCLRLGPTAMRRPSWAVKRAVDAGLAGLGLLLAAPILAACAIAVRVDGGPGVIFRQERIGLDGETFTVLKFRSLRPADEQESATRWNISQDQRMSAIGRFLRRTSLDELPQLWNVLRGEMSLVGPRPERPYFVTRFAQAYPQYRDRHRVPVGITGFAQVNGLRGDTSIEDRTRFDNYYIESWSLWQDVKILLRTISSVLQSDGS